MLVTKDRDFRDSQLLLKVRDDSSESTGNITNDDLFAPFEANLTLIVDAYENASFIEISQTSVIIHEL